MILLSVAMAWAAQAAQPAERWVALLDHDAGGISAYDANSVERDGDILRVRIIWDRSGVPNPSFREGRLYNEIDCAARTGRVLSYIAWRDDGSVAAFLDTPTPAQPLAPGTAGQALWNALCSAEGRSFPEPPE